MVGHHVAGETNSLAVGAIAKIDVGRFAADVFGDGWQDLFVANVDQEMFSLYKNMKNETFRDVAFKNGVAQATSPTPLTGASCTGSDCSLALARAMATAWRAASATASTLMTLVEQKP